MKNKIKIMEVCGTHTSAIYKSGIKSLLPPEISLVSGPGCPVCVTSVSTVNALVECSKRENHVVLSFGDMFRLLSGAVNIRLIYSPLEAIKLANENPQVQYTVASVGFETTIPVYAILLEQLMAQNIENVKLLTSMKTMPEALKYICENEEIDGFLCPGHVSAIIGSDVYNNLCSAYKKPFVIAGFEPKNILAAINEIVNQSRNGIYKVVNLYKSVVSPSGQGSALALIDKYFVKSDAYWRGIGNVKNSGYILKEEYKNYNLSYVEAFVDDYGECRCRDVLLGRIEPKGCGLFLKKCTPSDPIGACMVSSEGACRVYAEES